MVPQYIHAPLADIRLIMKHFGAHKRRLIAWNTTRKSIYRETKCGAPLLLPQTCAKNLADTEVIYLKKVYLSVVVRRFDCSCRAIVSVSLE